jgi:hypothetical protein
MIDRELLEYAAKAAGIEILAWTYSDYAVVSDKGDTWTPLADDGDALRLAVKCGIDISFNDAAQCVYAGESMEPFNRNPDICAVTRRAIVREAAEIGRAKGE